MREKTVRERAIEFLRSNRPIVVDTTRLTKCFAVKNYKPMSDAECAFAYSSMALNDNEFNPALDCLHYFEEGLVVCGFDFSKPF